ncbi:MAG: accessory gene regulator B family protein [Lachnospiraceae bacterium]|nr:accessory gene regulator B family protein [Lachnospiraceae bacterium]
MCFEYALEDTGWDNVIRAVEQSERLLRATIAGDEEEVAEQIDICHRENTSILNSSVIVLSKYVIAGWKVTNLILYGIYVIYIYFRAPIPSATRPVFSVQRKKRLKVYAFVVITGWISVCYLFQGNGVWINCIEWTLLLHIVEILFVEGGRALWQKTRLLRKSVNS